MSLSPTPPTTKTNNNKSILSNANHFLRPAAKMAIVPSPKNSIVYRRLANNIRQRAATRVIRKNNKQMAKHPAHSQCRAGGAGISRQREDCHLIDNHHHPIARNRASYNRKKNQTAIVSKTASNATTSAYNDGNIWMSSTVSNGPSLELFKHMSSQPLHKDAKDDVILNNDDEKKTESVECVASNDNESNIAVSPRNTPALLDKENVDIQLSNNDYSNDTAQKTLQSIAAVGEEKVLPAKDSMDAVTSAEQPPTVSRLTILISKGVHDYTQAANQNATTDLLTDLSVPYNVVDGMDPSQREKRDEFFSISGIRGNYPQIFVSNEADDGHRFLGGYDWLNSMSIEDLKALVSSDEQPVVESKHVAEAANVTTSLPINNAKARMVVLISKGVHDYTQAANQNATTELLTNLSIPYDIVDGMDPLQRERREEFFSISGIRGNYPQIFYSPKDNTGTYIYLGGHEFLQSIKNDELKSFGS